MDSLGWTMKYDGVKNCCLGWLKVISRPSLYISVVACLGLALEISPISKTLKCHRSDSFESFALKALDFIKVISRLVSHVSMTPH